jgi:hypothetical protein
MAAGGGVLARRLGGQRLAVSATGPPALPAGGVAGAAVADTIFTDGKVATVDASDTITEALALAGGNVLATGTTEEIKRLAGPATEVVDLKGRTLTPGLIDTHCHLEAMGYYGGYLTPFLPPAVTTLAELQEALAEEVAHVGPQQWVKGFWLQLLPDQRNPSRWELDAVSPRNPVFLMHQPGHMGSANSAALDIAGVTASTPDPTGGIVERDSHGEPTGVLFNHPAMDLVRRALPVFTTAMISEAIVCYQPLFLASGVISFHDNNLRGASTVRACQDVARAGKMRMRQSLYFTLEGVRDLTPALSDMDTYFDAYSRFAGFKFLIDGQAQTAYCHQPHSGTSWSTPTWDPATFKQAIRSLHDAGLQICVHCVGDAAADLALEGFEEAMNANPRPDPRHRLEHAVLTTPEATQRIRDLGVVISTQPQFITMSGDSYEPLFGSERCKRLLVTREWLEAGIPVALSSDTPTTPWYRPQVTLVAAQVRKAPSGKVVGGDQTLTFRETLRAHTITAAYAGHEERIKGSLEPGKLADLIVWTHDPYTMTLRELWDATIDLTVVGGKAVYRAPRGPRPRLHPTGS